mmetsp:Transcript_8617/g.15469  ORF Transcript_8617/g.15469 Transcript_8617/m.15469 type:complete len:329 (-) Transcript_8617:24-1010(-)
MAITQGAGRCFATALVCATLVGLAVFWDARLESITSIATAILVESGPAPAKKGKRYPKSSALVREARGRNALLREPVATEGVQGCVPAGMTVARLHFGFDMVVLGRNDIVSGSLLSTGAWELKSAAAFAAAMQTQLPTNGTFVDIGANIGYYSMLFAHAGFNVLAFEPMTRNRAAIEGTLCLHPELRSRVKVIPAALVAPEEVDKTRCVIRSTNYEVNIGNGFLKCGSPEDVKGCTSGDANCEIVPVMTLNDALARENLASVDVVKMDVEAFECHVMAGGETLFTKYRPKMLKIETEWGTKSCVEAAAAKHNYRTVNMGSDTGLVRLP